MPETRRDGVRRRALRFFGWILRRLDMLAALLLGFGFLAYLIRPTQMVVSSSHDDGSGRTNTKIATRPTSFQ